MAHFNAYFIAFCMQCKIGGQKHCIFRGSFLHPFLFSPERNAKTSRGNPFLLSGVSDSVGFRHSTAKVGGKRVFPPPLPLSCVVQEQRIYEDLHAHPFWMQVRLEWQTSSSSMRCQCHQCGHSFFFHQVCPIIEESMTHFITA